MDEQISRAAVLTAIRDCMVAMEWPPQDGDRQIDEVLAAINALPAVAVTDDMVERARECAKEHTDDIDIDWREILQAALNLTA